MPALTTIDALLHAAGDHASLPAASDVAKGTVYPCTTHGKFYQTTDGATWVDWHDPADASVATHSHDGGDITTGTVADARVASTIARDSEVAAAVTGLLELAGSTNASTNPNYPAANKGDAYVVTNAGKVGGASGKSVDVGDVYLAIADNAGGTEASVGTSWVVLEHNLVGALLAANNLSDLASAATARTNLGLVIGTDVQAALTAASQAEMEAGTEAGLRSMSPLRVAQAIAALAAGGGGGGGAPTSSKYVVAASDGTLSAEIIIPGLAGSPDIAAGGGSDDEFDTTDSSDPMTGWTTLGAPTAHDMNTTAKSHYYIKRNNSGTGNPAWSGIYKASPATPFTVTAMLADQNGMGNYSSAGLFIGTATPGAMEVMTVIYDSNTDCLGVFNYSSPTAYNATVYGSYRISQFPIYFRCVVTSTTNIKWQYSLGGLLWRTVATGRNPGFTIGSVGLAASGNQADSEGIFDWIRFT